MRNFTIINYFLDNETGLAERGQARLAGKRFSSVEVERSLPGEMKW